MFANAELIKHEVIGTETEAFASVYVWKVPLLKGSNPLNRSSRCKAIYKGFGCWEWRYYSGASKRRRGGPKKGYFVVLELSDGKLYTRHYYKPDALKWYNHVCATVRHQYRPGVMSRDDICSMIFGHQDCYYRQVTDWGNKDHFPSFYEFELYLQQHNI